MRPSVDLQSSLCVKLSFLLVLFPENFCSLVSLDSQLHLLYSRRTRGSAWISSPCIAGNSLKALCRGNHKTRVVCFPFSGITLLCCLIFSLEKAFSYVFGLFFFLRKIGLELTSAANLLFLLRKLGSELTSVPILLYFTCRTP